MGKLIPGVPTTAALAYRATMLARFPRAANWGIYSCRHIAGSSTWSQHAWANAVDLAPPDRAYGDKMAEFVRANAGALRIEHLLWQVRDHYDHIHVDFTPNFTGTPTCAGGPAVFEMKATTPRTGTCLKRDQDGNCLACPKGYTLVFGVCIESKRLPGGTDNPFRSVADALADPFGIGEKFKGIIKVIGTWAKIGAGGVLILGGVAVISVAVSGQSNRVARAVSRSGGSRAASAVPGERTTPNTPTTEDEPQPDIVVVSDDAGRRRRYKIRRRGPQLPRSTPTEAERRLRQKGILT